MQQRFGHDSASVLPRPPKPYAVSVQVAKLTDRLAKLEGKFESLSKSAAVEGSRTWVSAVEEGGAHAFAEAEAAAPARRAPASLFSPEFPSAVPPGSNRLRSRHPESRTLGSQTRKHSSHALKISDQPHRSPNRLQPRPVRNFPLNTSYDRD